MNIILGVNGSGKSSILAAVALVVLSPIIASSGYRPYALIRRSNRGKVSQAKIKAELTLHEQDGAKPVRGAEVTACLETIIAKRGDTEQIRNADTFGPIWEGMFREINPAFLLVGYGATRRVQAMSAEDFAELGKARYLRYERVASLFESRFPLRPLTSWLPQLQRRNRSCYEQVVHLIDRLTPPSISFGGHMERREYLFRHRSVSVPFGALSDGYKAYIGWLGDLFFHLSAGAKKDTKLISRRGIVLVDEIDLHIHPAWQRTIIPQLARTLKNLQFIFTTHSPLVVGTLERVNILSVERGRNGLPTLKRPAEEVFGLSADQILRSDTFGLDSTRDVDFRAKLTRLSKEASEGKPGAAVEFMRKVAIGSGGSLPAEELPPEWLRKLSKRAGTSSKR